MLSPPAGIIERARLIALGSTCAKSKRGAVVYLAEQAKQMFSDPATAFALGYVRAVIRGEGFNGKPIGFACDDSQKCKDACGKACVHAEARAIREAIPFAVMDLCDLVHVKVVDGKVVAGGPPSCWQCSREIVDVGLRGVWLYETVPIIGIPPQWRYYDAREFHVATLRNNELLDRV